MARGLAFRQGRTVQRERAFKEVSPEITAAARIRFRPLHGVVKVSNRLAIARAVVTLCLVTAAANAKAESLTQYQQLHKMLFSGVPTTAIFTPDKCRSGQQTPAATTTPSISGGLAIREFIEVKGSTIVFADKHFTVKPTGAAVIEFIQYRVMQDDSGTVTVQTLSPTTFEPLAEAQVFQCTLGDGLRFAYAPVTRD
jgi:hypothetical protein